MKVSDTVKHFFADYFSVLFLINKRYLPFPLDSHIIISTEKPVNTLGFEYIGFSEGMSRTHSSGL